MTSVRNHSPKIIAVASGKGGVGKTWFSATLAHTLARLGRKVLLFDGDIGLANIDIQLGLMPEKDLGHVISGALPLKSAVTRFEDSGAGAGGFDVLAGKSGSGALNMLTRERIESLKADIFDLGGVYDHVILDLAAGVDQAVTSFSDDAGLVYVVLTADPTSLTDAYAFIKLKAMRGKAADIRIVVNQAAGKREGEKTYESLRKACEGFLKLSPPLAGIIRTDRKVSDAIRHQSALLLRHPQSEAAEDVDHIAHGIRSNVTALAS